MELIAILALFFSVCAVALCAYLLGRGATRPPIHELEEPETAEERKARERVQDGVENIMSYEVGRGFMGDGER